METHILFFILAGLLIAVLIGYSLWAARREKSRVFSNTFSTRPVSAPIGASAPHAESETVLHPLDDVARHSEVTAETVQEAEWQAQQEEIESQVQEIKIKLPNQPEPVAPQASPVFAAAEPQPQVTIQPQPQEEKAVEEAPVENEFVTLYVVAAEGTQFNGLQVAQQLDALGLQFGEYHIFHRHIDNANSPVLFSVANMMQPGVFDVNNLEQFYTVGLVFFMQLPSPTNDLANVRIMINTAESLAKSLGGFVLNDQQQLFDETSRQAYLLRVKQP